jgi:predicted transcriptional regulator
MKPSLLTITPDDGLAALKGLASPVRIRMLELIHERGPLNINEISKALKLPQSTVATNVQVLEEAGLVLTQTIPARSTC